MFASVTASWLFSCELAKLHWVCLVDGLHCYFMYCVIKLCYSGNLVIHIIELHSTERKIKSVSTQTQ